MTITTYQKFNQTSSSTSFLLVGLVCVLFLIVYSIINEVNVSFLDFHLYLIGLLPVAIGLGCLRYNIFSGLRIRSILLQWIVTLVMILAFQLSQLVKQLQYDFFKLVDFYQLPYAICFAIFYSIIGMIITWPILKSYERWYSAFFAIISASVIFFSMFLI